MPRRSAVSSGTQSLRRGRHTSEPSAAFRRTTLPGGLRVVTEYLPGVRSASVGVWVGVGSRDEGASVAGAAHFLEHLLFKSTPTRTAVDKAYAAALRNGGSCEGAPGLRLEYHPDYYGAYFRDADGNKLCVCCHDAVA